LIQPSVTRGTSFPVSQPTSSQRRPRVLGAGNPWAARRGGGSMSMPYGRLPRRRARESAARTCVGWPGTC